MIVKPVNKRLLVEKVEVEQKETSIGFFIPEEKTTNFSDFYRVLDKSEDCAIMVEEGDLISAEVVIPVGKLENKFYFVCHENSVVAVIKE